MDPDRELTAARAREVFDYDPASGVLSWRPRPRCRVVGKPAGGKKGNGYLKVVVDGRPYLVHRVIWLHVTGAFPCGNVDHLNGERADNRWSNLRDVPSQVNSQNRRSTRGASGLLGASWDPEKRRFQAGITVNGKRKLLGRYRTAEEAHAAYVEAKRRLHAGCTL